MAQVETTLQKVNFTVKTFLAILVGVASIVFSATTFYWVTVENDRKAVEFRDEIERVTKDIESDLHDHRNTTTKDIVDIKTDDGIRFQAVKDDMSALEDALRIYIQEKDDATNGRIDRKTERNYRLVQEILGQIRELRDQH